MPIAKKAPPLHLWWVRHPDCGLAIVDAPNWELATVEAAKWWDVPWREVAALCECERHEEVPRHVCIRCGRVFNGDGLRCTRCEVVERDRELNRRTRAKKFYQTMMPRKQRPV